MDSGVKQTTSTGAMLPPRDFLKDLQRVMTKKWQVAEKCREGSQPNVREGTPSSPAMLTPHQVLGFRDPIDKLGSGHTYSRDESVGAWVLQTQQYAERQLQRTEPLYAMSSKQQEQQQYVQNRQMINPSPAMAMANQVPKQRLQQQSTNALNAQNGTQHINNPMSPVVLREPTPEYDPYSSPNYPQNYCNQSITPNNRKIKPPPPMRSPNPQSYDQNGQIYETIGNINGHQNGTFVNGTQQNRPVVNNGGNYPSPGANYPPHASSIGHITANSFNVGGCAYASRKKSIDKPPPPPPKRSETTQLSTK